MTIVDETSSRYIDSITENKDKNPEFKIGDIVRISKYKNIFAKGYTPYWSEQVFMIKKLKNTVRWTYAIDNIKSKGIVGIFCEKEL